MYIILHQETINTSICSVYTYFFLITMMFYRYPCIRCKSLSSALRERFSKCPLFAGKLSGLSSEAEDAARDFDEEDEVTLYLRVRLMFSLFLFCIVNQLDFSTKKLVVGFRFSGHEQVHGVQMQAQVCVRVGYLEMGSLSGAFLAR